MPWPEMHGMLTHFPVAMILAAAGVDALGLFSRKAEWRTAAFWMLAIGALMTIPSAVTGWLTAHNLFSGSGWPAIVRYHVGAAVTTVVISWAALAWRASRRDAAAPLALALLAAAAVGVTGYLGGKMVFGGVDTSAHETSVATPAPPADAAMVSLGAKLIRDPSIGCVNCHQLDGAGGKVGPDLTHVGSRRPDAEWHIRHLKDPAAVHPGSIMPSYSRLKDAQLRGLADYLVSRR